MKYSLLAACLLAPVAASGKDGPGGIAVIQWGKDAPIADGHYVATPPEGWPFVDGTFDTLQILPPKKGSFVATVLVDGKPVCHVKVTKATKPVAECAFKMECAQQLELVVSELKGTPGRTGVALPYDRSGVRCDDQEKL
jgi:hypothetical protein